MKDFMFMTESDLNEYMTEALTGQPVNYSWMYQVRAAFENLLPEELKKQIGVVLSACNKNQCIIKYGATNLLLFEMHKKMAKRGSYLGFGYTSSAKWTFNNVECFWMEGRELGQVFTDAAIALKKMQDQEEEQKERIKKVLTAIMSAFGCSYENAREFIREADRYAYKVSDQF